MICGRKFPLGVALIGGGGAAIGLGIADMRGGDVAGGVANICLESRSSGSGLPALRLERWIAGGDTLVGFGLM